MPKAPYFIISFWLKVYVFSLNLIAFIISIETEASLLALAKSIDYWVLHFEKIGEWVRFQVNGKSVSCARALKTFKLGILLFDIYENFLCQNEEEVKGNTLAGSFAFRSGIHLNFWWRTFHQANQGIDGIIIAFLEKGNKTEHEP